jgi:hypothetical protein
VNKRNEFGHGPDCDCGECMEITDREDEWRYEHEKLYGKDGLLAHYEKD